MSEHTPAAAREESFTELFRAHYGHVSAFARRRVTADAAKDIVAETFLVAWRQLDAIPADPLPWLYRVAGRAVATHYRASRRGQALDDRARLMVTDTVEPDHADVVVEGFGLAAAFCSLAESEREVLRLVSWEGLDAQRAAAVVGCSLATFKVRLHRARRHFRAALEALTNAQRMSESRALTARPQEENR
jgi:RNA polymerase sigma factor (sigma-70 family)